MRISLVTDSAQGLEFESGFSGAPVWDHAAHGVIGMVGWREGPRGEGITEVRKGYATAIKTIAELWQPLAPHMVHPHAYRRRKALAEATELSLADDGGLPLVSEVDIYDLGIGVQPSSYPPGQDPYIRRREIDEALELGLAETRFVIASGLSLSGKSRAVIEMLRRTRGDARLAVPRSNADALRQIAEALPDERDVVVWLDDLSQFPLDGKLLHELIRDRDWNIAATTRSASGGAAEPSREFERLLRSKRRGKSIVEVSTRPTDDELRQSAELYPGEEFEVHGIGAQLACAEDLERRFSRGMDERLPGWAVVQAAVDWRRMGMTRPITRQQLRILSGLVLAEIGPDTDDAFAAGLAWAVDAADEKPPLLTEDAGSGYRVFSRLIERADDETSPTGRPVPGAAWSCLPTKDMALDGEDLVAATIAAAAAGRQDVAREAASRARLLAPGGAVYAWATLFLGWLSLGEDAGQVHELFLEAAAAAVPEVTGWARLEVGVLEVQLGELDQGEEHLRAAAADEDASVAALAKASLGSLLLRLGRLDEGEVFLESVLLAKDDAEAVSVASRQYAQLYSSSGLAGSFEKGGDSRALASSGRPSIQRLRESLREQGGTRARRLASLELGGLVLSRGRDPDRVKSLLEEALQSDDPDIVLPAHLSLGQLLASLGERPAAKEHLQKVLGAGNPQLEAEALIELAKVAYANGDIAAAIGGLRKVRDSGDPDYAPAAADTLGDLYCAEGEVAAGREAYRWAIASGHPSWSRVAAVDLAITLCRGSYAEPEHGLQLLREQAASGDRVHAPRAAAVLGTVFAEQGNAEEARAAYEQAIKSGHPYWAPMARAELALILGQEQHELAENLLTAAEDADHAEISVRAHILHMALLADRGGDVAEEIERHRQAAAELAKSPRLTFSVTFWQLLGAAERRDLNEAAALAMELGRVTETISGSGHSSAPDPSDTEPAEPAALYLAVADQLYDAEYWRESSMMLDMLRDHCVDALSPVSLAALRARLGRARFTQPADMIETEAILRDALTQSIRLGAPAAASEALARYYLASLLAVGYRLDEARQVALPLVETDHAHLGRTLHLLGRIAIKAAPQQQGELARQEFRTAGRLLREAREEAQRVGDERLDIMISRDIKDLEEQAAGITEDTIEPPAPEGPSPIGSRPLPPRLLCLLGLAAGAEGELDEASYWFDRAEHSFSDFERAAASAESVGAIRHELNQARASLLLDADAEDHNSLKIAR